MKNAPPGRLMTLDAFRGMTIAAMILVNDPGSWEHVYAQLRHSQWVGCTFTDVIFPFFLFIAGVAMWFSFQKTGGQDRGLLWKKVLLRASLIFLIGLFIEWFPFYDLSLERLHFIGVLQRIAVSYVIAATVCISFSRMVIGAVAALLLLGYWALIAQSGGPDPYARDVAFSHGIDFVSFRSCISSAVPIMIGFLCGSFVQRRDYDLKFFSTLAGVGVALILVGRLWGLHFPIIKSLLWSSSYVLYAVGIGILAFTACFWIIEKKRARSWAHPFVLFGLNPLFLYVVSIILDKLTWLIRVGSGDASIPLHQWIHQTVFQPLAGDLNGSLLYALCFVGLHWLIAYVLYARDIFIKV